MVGWGWWGGWVVKGGGSWWDRVGDVLCVMVGWGGFCKIRYPLTSFKAMPLY